jgi:hypothetical protein
VLLKLNIPYVTQNKAKVRCKFTKFADPRTKFCRVGEGGGGAAIRPCCHSKCEKKKSRKPRLDVSFLLIHRHGRRSLAAGYASVDVNENMIGGPHSDLAKVGLSRYKMSMASGVTCRPVMWSTACSRSTQMAHSRFTPVHTLTRKRGANYALDLHGQGVARSRRNVVVVTPFRVRDPWCDG